MSFVKHTVKFESPLTVQNMKQMRLKYDQRICGNRRGCTFKLFVTSFGGKDVNAGVARGKDPLGSLGDVRGLHRHHLSRLIDERFKQGAA